MTLRVRRIRFAFLEGDLLVYRFLFFLPLFFTFLTGGSIRNASSPIKGPFGIGTDLQHVMHA
jgi:hypothetical protein